MTIINTKINIPAELNDARLDQALAALYPEYSRNLIQQWIRNGNITIDGKSETRPRTKVKTDQEIVINAEQLARENWEAEAIPLDIVYEDNDLLIINKPAGLIVHPGAGNPGHTLVNALVHYDPQLANVPRAGIVHRLDKDTTGLLVVARQLASYHYLSTAIQERVIQREYQAIVHGVPISGGTIDAPIGRHQQARTQMSVKQMGGREAITHYRIIQRYRFHTHLRINLETGRTHQIRVHMAHIRHPLVGDPVYGRRLNPSESCSTELKQKLREFDRQALHASRLTLIHPTTHESVSFEAPLPVDMQELLVVLQNDYMLSKKK